MDAKITLSFDKAVIKNAKEYAEQHNISLSRLTEFLLRQITSGEYKNLEELPISDWVAQVAEGDVQYRTKAQSRKSLKEAYYKSRK